MNTRIPGLAPGTYQLQSKPQDAVWLRIEGIDVGIKHDDEGVVVDLWSRGAEPQCLATTALSFAEAAEDNGEASHAPR